MEIQEYLERMKTIQTHLLTFIESNQNDQEEFQNLIQLFDNQKIRDDKHQFQSVLNLISKIINSHHHSTNFFLKIEQILQNFKNETKLQFSNFEIFNIFKENKRILLYLLKENIIVMDKRISNIIQSEKYIKDNYTLYFFPEIKPFLKLTENSEEQDESESEFDKKYRLSIQEFSKNLPENFEEKRKTGENDNVICQLIRNDSIKEFVDYIDQKKLQINAKTEVEPSIYETNQYLIRFKKTNLIEYSAFYGSIQIFKHLLSNDIELTQSIWIAAIHSNNLELIHLLEEKSIKFDPYEKCVKESIKCHHNKIKDLIQNTHLNGKEINSLENLQQTIKYHNFAYLSKEQVDQSVFYDFCNNDFYLIVDHLLKSGNIDINHIIISKKIKNFLFSLKLLFFLWNFKNLFLFIKLSFK